MPSPSLQAAVRRAGLVKEFVEKHGEMPDEVNPKVLGARARVGVADACAGKARAERVAAARDDDPPPSRMLSRHLHHRSEI